MPDIGDLSLQSTLQSEQDNTAQIKPKRTRRAGRRRQRQRNDKCNNLNESSIIQLAKQHCTSQSVTCNLPFGYSSPREINYSFKPELNAVSTRFMQPNLQQHQNKDDRLTKFSIMSWNVLSEQYANRPRFDYVAPSLLDWKARSAHILHTIMSSNADIIALQEVDESFYNNVLLPTLNEYNYKGVYERKRHHNLTDGCAILYREERFKLGSISVIHYQESNLKETIENIDNAANPSTTSKSNSTQQRDLACRFNMHHNLAIIAKFCDQRTGRHLRVVNTHLLADPTYSDAKLLQVALLCEKLEQQDQYDLKNGLSNSQPTPTVLCGDWNSLPDSDVMAYLLRGRIGRQAFGGNNFGRFTRSRTLRHRLQLACAYAAAGAKISATVRTPQFTGEIDRILYTSSESLRVVSTLGDINQQHRRIFFPNEEIPSDHIPLLAIFTDTPTESSPQVNGDIDTALIEISHTLSKDISKLTSSMPKTLILPMRQKDIPTTMPCYATNQVANSSIGMPMMSTAHPLSTDYFIKLSDIKGILKEESRSPRRYRGSRGKRGGKRAARANAKGKDTTKSQKKTNNNSESLVTAV
ncbi:Endonuclease/exonuclease/phosphatase [Syncephalis fuscata]|nr:Endonuclease/exonuclease/phosphatase [Syncephalis fuscata]